MDDDEPPQLVEAAPELKESKRVPLTLITGFLGAGKSTFLQYVLTQRHGHRIAVIMNEFGDSADIESHSISTTSAESPRLAQEVLELPNGCLCCTIKDTGISAIENLMKTKGEAFDYILLETTGLADPGPITAIFWQNEEFTQGSGTNEIYLDGVICVIDAVFGLEQLTSGEYKDLSMRQLAHATTILINKSDLADSSTIKNLESEIKSINPLTPTICTTKGVASLQEVLDQRGFAHYKTLSGPAPHIHEEGEAESVHHHDVEAVTIQLPVLDTRQLDKLDEWVRSVLWEGCLPSIPDKVEVLRSKGLFHVATGLRRSDSELSDLDVYSLQGVQNIYEINPVKDSPSLKEGKLVFIGKFGTVKAESMRKNLIEYLNIKSV